MPKVTASGGPSNAAAELELVGEDGPELVELPDGSKVIPAEDPPPPPPASAPKAEHAEYAAEVLGVPAEEAAALKKAELVDLNRSAAEGESTPLKKALLGE